MDSNLHTFNKIKQDVKITRLIIRYLTARSLELGAQCADASGHMTVNIVFHINKKTAEVFTGYDSLLIR